MNLCQRPPTKGRPDPELQSPLKFMHCSRGAGGGETISEIGRRTCWIRELTDDEPGALEITFHAPVGQDGLGFDAPITLRCKYFERSFCAGGADEMQALLAQPFIATAWLRGRSMSGFQIYWHAPGDLDWRSFWSIPLDQPIYLPE